MRKVIDSAFGRIFGIDWRSLALFRVALGLVYLYDLVIRASDISVYYTDTGVLPRVALLRNTVVYDWAIDLHLLSGLTIIQAALFAVAGLAALAMTVGYRTRLATFIAYLLLISVQNRNPLILHAGDVELRLLLLWSLFLPLGARYSIDSLQARLRRPSEEPVAAAAGTPRGKTAAARVRAEVDGPETIREPAESEARVLSVATTGTLLQVCFIYWFAAILKNQDLWRNGTAVYYAFQVDQLARPLAHFLLNYPEILRQLTFSTYSIERLGPVFALIPFWHGRIRTAALLAFIGFHTCLGMTLSLGNFPFVAITAWLLFLPTETWHTLVRWWAAKARPAWNDLSESLNRLAVRLSRALPGGQAVPEYAVTRASNVPVAGGWRTQALAAFFLFYVFMWNLRSTDFDRYVTVFPRSVNWIGDLTRVDQMWNLFAPPPIKGDGWYVIPATLANGQEVDLFNHGEPVKWTKPPLVVATNKNEREEKFMDNLREGKPAIRRYYANYLCREWNRTHSAEMQVTVIKIYFMAEDTLPDNKVSIPRMTQLGVYLYGSMAPLPTLK